MTIVALESLLRAKPPDLFHYTGHAGLHGIVQEREMRATEVRFQNDGGELRYAVNLVREYVTDYGARVKEFDELERRLFDDALAWTDSTARAYVASFSEDGDLLSQWRGYGGAGGGYSLGFDGQGLRVAAEGEGWELGQVCYDKEVQWKIVDSWAQAAVEDCTRGRFDAGSAEPPGARGLLRNLMRYGLLLKDKAFEEEKEWRLLSPTDPGEWTDPGTRFHHKIHFREGLNCLIPYVKLPFPPRTFTDLPDPDKAPEWERSYRSSPWPLKSVRVGPGPEQALRQRAARILLSVCADGDRVEVTASATPYRGRL